MYKKLAGRLAKLPLFWKIFFSAVIAAAILALLAYSLWLQFFADTVIAWTPDNTVFYSHLSIPRYRGNNSYNKLADSLLAQTGISSTTDNIVKRELAFAYLAAGGKYQSLVFLRADSPYKLEKMLQEKKIGYRRLNREDFVLGQSEIINSLIKNPQNQLIAKTKKHFSAWSTLSLYSEKQFITAWLKDNSADYWQYVLLELAGGDDLYFNLFSNKEKNWGWLGEFRGRKKIKLALPADKDLIFNLSNAEQMPAALASENLPSNISQIINEANYSYGLDLANPAIKELAKNKISGSIKNNNSTGTGWLWADKEVLVKISGRLDDAKTKTLEKILKNILARQKPQDKKIQLHDGSAITERVLNPEVIEFSSANGLMASNQQLPVRIFYQTSTAGIAFSNNQDLLLATSTKTYSNDFISIKTKLLNGRGFWNYLKNFENLEVYDNGQVTVK